jgi:hypothetical protein
MCWYDDSLKWLYGKVPYVQRSGPNSAISLRHHYLEGIRWSNACTAGSKDITDEGSATESCKVLLLGNNVKNVDSLCFLACYLAGVPPPPSPPHFAWDGLGTQVWSASLHYNDRLLRKNALPPAVAWCPPVRTSPWPLAAAWLCLGFSWCPSRCEVSRFWQTLSSGTSRSAVLTRFPERRSQLWAEKQFLCGRPDCDVT